MSNSLIPDAARLTVRTDKPDTISLAQLSPHMLPLIIKHAIIKKEERLMNFDLNEEQADIRDMVRRFAAQEMVPYAEEWDETNHFPREVYTKMAELGLTGMTTPEELGG